MPASPNFTFQKGEDVAIDWSVLQAEDGPAQDVTGWTFALKVKRRASDADPSLVTVTNTITAAATGQVQSTILAAATAALRGDYAYSFWRTNAGSASCLAKGTMTFDDTTQS